MKCFIALSFSLVWYMEDQCMVLLQALLLEAPIMVATTTLTIQVKSVIQLTKLSTRNNVKATKKKFVTPLTLRHVKMWQERNVRLFKPQSKKGNATMLMSCYVL